MKRLSRKIGAFFMIKFTNTLVVNVLNFIGIFYQQHVRQQNLDEQCLSFAVHWLFVKTRNNGGNAFG